MYCQHAPASAVPSQASGDSHQGGGHVETGREFYVLDCSPLWKRFTEISLLVRVESCLCCCCDKKPYSSSLPVILQEQSCLIERDCHCKNGILVWPLERDLSFFPEDSFVHQTYARQSAS